MARLDPFYATIYNADHVVADDVIAPPYDIGAPARAGLAARSSYNAIHVELPVAVPELGMDPYRAAADLFEQWHCEGTLAVTDRPCFALYRMTFRDEGGTLRTTVGVLGALGLDPEHTGQVLPHEQTIARDRHDRLSLLRTARTNFSPIWALSLADGFANLCESAVAKAREPWRATDEDGVLHERWIVTDAGVLSALSELAATAPVLIADGHHRYETACAYLEEDPARRGADAVLALVGELSEQELSVRAIHRLVRGVDPVGFARDLERSFVVSDGPDDPVALREEMRSRGALGLLSTAGSWLLEPRPELLDPAADDLDSSRLAAVLGHLGVNDVSYQHGVHEVVTAVKNGIADAAVLLRPASIEQIAATARNRRRMPPKSTFFWPKPRTGMVFRELERA